MRFLFLALILTASAVAQRPFTLEDIWVNYWFFPRGAEGFNATADGKHYLAEDDGGLAKYRFDAEAPVAGYRFSFEGRPLDGFDSYRLSSDEQKVLLATETESIYRYSSRSVYLVGNLADGELRLLTEGQKVRYADFSPDGKHVSYVSGNNLYIKSLEDNTLRQITEDGRVNSIINGASDWVYEEEFVLVQAYDWSPSSAYLAYLKFDESEVPEFTMPMFGGGLYPENYVFKYPKVGEKNAEVSAWVHHVASGKAVQVSLPSGVEYLPRLWWTPDDRLVLLVMNRLQNHMRLLLADPESGSTRVIWEERSDTYLELPEDPVFLAGSSRYLLTSEKSGFKHLYVNDFEKQSSEAMTEGAWEIRDFLGFHEGRKEALYTSTETGSMETQLFAVNLKGKKRQITKAPGTHDISWSGNYFVDNYSRAHAPYRAGLYDLDGNELRVLNREAYDIYQKLYNKQLQLKPPVFFSAPAADGSSLNAFAIYPPNFDSSKTYPVLMYVYGGPGSQEVTDGWMGPNYGWFQYLSTRGVVVVCADNRGTGGRGKAFRDITYGRLGEIETRDQLSVARWLQAKSWVKDDAIAMFGWSYGGYMAALCTFQGSDVLSAGISVAPVTNWRFYDNIYTERYMGTMQTNPKGFDKQAPIRFADKLEGDFLLIHGSADDNVHWQNTAELSMALIQANKDFEQFIYPDKNHGIYGGNTRLHLYRMMTRFLEEKVGMLNGE